MPSVIWSHGSYINFNKLQIYYKIFYEKFILQKIGAVGYIAMYVSVILE